MRRTTSVSAPVAHLVGPGRLKVVNGNLAFAAPGQPPLRLDPAALPLGGLLRRRLGQRLGGGDAAGPRHPDRLDVAGRPRCRGRLKRQRSVLDADALRQHQAFGRLEARLEWAQRVVVGKVEAQSAAARHYQRHGQAAAGPVLVQLDAAAQAVPRASTLDEVRGIEGAASAAWFRLLGELLRPPWQFPQRTRRPPTDPVNALV